MLFTLWGFVVDITYETLGILCQRVPEELSDILLVKLFPKNFFLRTLLDDSGISLPFFPSRTNLKL